MSGRYAIYFAPVRRSPWWDFGAWWLGRDDAALPPHASHGQTQVPGFSAVEFAALTAVPRRYGFHATLKAPMRLAEISERQLVERVNALATTLHAVPLGTLVPVQLDGFLALVPAQPIMQLDLLAARCVTELDDLRAPLDDNELARRQPGKLDARQRQLLERWGYPHVLEHFRFHMTVTGPVEAPVAQHLIEHMRLTLAHLNAQQPLVLDRLCVFHEPAPGALLRRIHDAPLAA
jgi:putative phosphonate metabolism protein